MIYDNNTSLMISPGLSAEQLGAYMEGNLNDTEQAYVETILNDDPQAAQLYTDVNETQIDWDANIYDEYPDFDNTFKMPEIDMQDYENYHDTSVDNVPLQPGHPDDLTSKGVTDGTDMSTTDEPHETTHETFEDNNFDETNENEIDEEPLSTINTDPSESSSQPTPTALETDETGITGHEEGIDVDGTDGMTF